MLFPFGYDSKKFTFLSLLSVQDLEYMCKEFDKRSKEICNQMTPSQNQAYLLSLSLQLYNELDVTKSGLERHLLSIKQTVGEDFDPQLSQLLDTHQSRRDLKWLENQLTSVLKSHSPISKPMHNPKMKTDRQKEEKRNEDKGTNIPKLISILGLADFYQEQCLSLSHALQIREETLFKKTENPGQDRKVNTKVISTDTKLHPFIILQKIMAFDRGCRRKAEFCIKKDSTVTLDQNNEDGEKSDSDSDDESSDSDSDNKADSIKIKIHPMDGLLSIVHCADNFLRQDLMSRLTTCQLSVPLLLPTPGTDNVTFLLWAMRLIIKEWKVDKQINEYPIVSYSSPIVSFMRFGHQKRSKSMIINLIMDSGHDYFFHYNCEGSDAKHTLLNGVVDMGWYLPSDSESVFPDVVTFLNLHGDAREFTKQVEFLSRVSFMCLVFLNKKDLDSHAYEVFQYLATLPGGFIVLTESSGVGKKMKESVSKDTFTVIKMNDKSDVLVKEDIQESILSKFDKLDTSPRQSLEKCQDIARKCNIKIDEKDKDCVEGKKLAKEVEAFLSNNSANDQRKESPKEHFLQLQGHKYWHKWGQHNKEQHRQIHREQQTIEEYASQQRVEMTNIRRSQMGQAISPNGLIKSFIRNLLSCENRVLHYYLQWLRLLLDELSRKLLPSLHGKFKLKRKELSKISSQKKKDENAEKKCKKELKDINEELLNASFGLEHLLREIGQYYEAVAASPQKDVAKCSLDILHLPEVAANLMINGYPLELMDGDAAHVPLTWVLAVLEQVKQKLGDPQLHILSVLGLQSTGKSTLLNTLFGLRFNVSAGRCTRGAYMQLLPFHSSLTKECNCEYTLILDTEGLRAPELDYLSTKKHDNELATFVIGLANLTLINIYGETTGDLDDILQTSVHAFLRMKTVRLNRNCHFVHQNVPAITAKDKGMAAKTNLKQKLDRMTQAAAEEEKMGDDFRSFNDIIKFDEEKNVTYFPTLWKGDPPMAPVNPGYSMNAQELKMCVIDFAKKNQSIHLSAFQECIKNLWEAILHQNFVFSFKNSLEIAAYNRLDAEYGEWSWDFRDKMLTWEQETKNILKGCRCEEESQNPCKVKSTGDNPCNSRLDNLNDYVNHLYLSKKKLMDEFFKEHSKDETMVQWKVETEGRLKRLKTQLEENAKKQCNKEHDVRKAMLKVENKKDFHRDRIVAEARNLASQLEKGKVKLNDYELKNKFYEHWKKWIEELRVDAVNFEKTNILLEMQKSLLEYFDAVHDLVIKRLDCVGRESETHNSGKSLTLWGKELKMKVTKCHLITKKTKPEEKEKSIPHKLLGLLKSAKNYVLMKDQPNQEELHMQTAQVITDHCLKVAEDYLHTLKQTHENYNQSFTIELLRKLSSELEELNSKDFTFTHDYLVELALVTCGYALKQFEDMADSYRKKYDIVDYFEREMREFLLMTFKNTYNQVAKEKAAATTLCKLMLTSIRKEVFISLNREIARAVRGEHTYTHTKPGLKKHVLECIGEDLRKTRRFKSCASYLRDTKQSFQEWIKIDTITYCDQYCKPDQQHNIVKQRKIVRLANTEIENLYTHIIETANSLSKILPSQWLENFHNKMKTKLELSLQELSAFVKVGDIKNISFFTEMLVKEFESAQLTLKEEFEKMRTTDIIGPKIQPYVDLLNQVSGCTEQCPFCQEQCDLTNAVHPTSNHSVLMHRPQCLGGFRWKDSEKMALELCTSLVGSEMKYRIPLIDDQFHPYKEYRNHFKNWDIKADTSFEASSFWKWVLGNYADLVAKEFNMKRGDETTLSEWKTITWEKVKSELSK